MAAAIDRLARLALLRHDSSRATALFSESLRLFGEIGDREGCGWALHHLGRMAYESGQNNQAIGYLIESLRLFDKLNDKWGFAWSLLRLAKVVSDLHQPEQAAILFGAAEAMMADFNDRMLISDRVILSRKLLLRRGINPMRPSGLADKRCRAKKPWRGFWSSRSSWDSKDCRKNYR